MSENQVVHELHELLGRYAALMQPVSYLEVGVREGDSMVCVLKACVPMRLYLCDDWGTAAGGTGRGNHAHIQAMLDDQALNVNPVFLDGNSHELLKKVEVTFQMITVDGDHSELGAAEDLKDCWPLLELNGFLFFDDIFHEQHMYLNDVLNRFLHDTPDARLVLRHKSKAHWTPGCAVVQKFLV